MITRLIWTIWTQVSGSSKFYEFTDWRAPWTAFYLTMFAKLFKRFRTFSSAASWRVNEWQQELDISCKPGISDKFGLKTMLLSMSTQQIFIHLISRKQRDDPMQNTQLIISLCMHWNLFCSILKFFFNLWPAGLKSWLLASPYCFRSYLLTR